MKKHDVAALIGFVGILDKAAAAWRGDYGVEIMAKLELAERDTSITCGEDFSAGAISQVTTPVLYIEYWIDQDENAAAIIEIPFVVHQTIPATDSAIRFHAAAIKGLLVDGCIREAPTESDWAAAEKITAQW